MQGQTLIAVYDTQMRAHEARNALIDSGLDADDIRLSSDGAGARATSTGQDASDNVGFFDWLFGAEVDERDRDRYRTKLDGERTAVSVYLRDGEGRHIEELLERFDPIDIHEENASTGTSTMSTPTIAGDGTAGGGVTAAGPSGFAHRSSAPSSAPGSDSSDEQVIPIVNENLDVGKRVEERRQRIRTYAVERPVERDVNLRDERVVIERRPVSEHSAGAATPDALQGREFEVVERHEVPVVDKQARVVEEVVVHKEAREHTEKVADTVRETRVDVDGNSDDLEGPPLDPTERRRHGDGSVPDVPPGRPRVRSET